MPRFVLLYHDCPADYVRQSHWDLMFEEGDALRTWALQQLPRDWDAAQAATSAVHAHCPLAAAENRIAAMKLGDHRSDYLEYEGRLSGNRGSVTRIASGYFATEIETDQVWRLSVSSETLVGSLVLKQSYSDSTQWTLEWLGCG